MPTVVLMFHFVFVGMVLTVPWLSEDRLRVKYLVLFTSHQEHFLNESLPLSTNR